MLRFSFNQGLNDLHITPNFVTKSYTVTSLHSEICRVSTFSLWSCQLHRPNIVSVRLNLKSNLNFFGLKIVPASLYQIKIFGPGKITVISYRPLFCKNLPWKNLVFIPKTFLYKSTLKPFWMLFCYFFR